LRQNGEGHYASGIEEWALFFTYEEVIASMPDLLATELDTYERQRNQLLAAGQGKYALVHGNTIVGVFQSKMDAISTGYERFGNTPFLIKQIVKVEIPQNFVSSLLGV
jgi:hypothetical protein